MKQVLKPLLNLIGLQADCQEQLQLLSQAVLAHEARLARQDALIERLDSILELG